MTEEEAEALDDRIEANGGYKSYPLHVRKNGEWMWVVKCWRRGSPVRDALLLKSPEEFPGRLIFEELV